MVALILALIFAVIFWFVLFGIEALNFWLGMAAAAGILALWSIILSGKKREKLFQFRSRHILIGIIAAAILYIIFWAGDAISTRIFTFASGQIDSIYGNKTSLDGWKIGLLLFFWIGPAEEIFWRGMVQRTLSDYFGDYAGWITGALIYAAVHLWAGNFVLFMAALIAGFFWGWIYKRYGSLWPGIISHSLWDVVIFLLMPV